MSLTLQLAETWFSDAVAAARNGEQERARELLRRGVLADDHHLQGWVWLANLTENPEEQRLCLERILALSLGSRPGQPAVQPSLLSAAAAAKPAVLPSLPSAAAGRQATPAGVPSAAVGAVRLAPLPGPAPDRLGSLAWPRPPWAGWDRLRSLARPGPRAIIALCYLAAVALAELVVTFVDPRLGLALHCLVLVGLFLGSTQVRDEAQRALLVSLVFAPLIRIVSLSLPLTRFPILYWYLLTSMPLFAALFVAAPVLGYSWRDLGLHLRRLPSQVGIGLVGVPFGAVEYYILRPQPLASSLTWEQIWWPALVLAICTGLLEEMIFRGLMQRVAGEALGHVGLAYVALLFAVLHLGYQSLPDVLFVLGVGLFLGWAVQHTRSLVGVTLAHGLTNIMLFLVMPFLAGS